MSLTIPQYKVPTIYVYTTPYYKNKNWYQGTRDGKGILKIGYTEQEDEEDRIKQQFPTLMPGQHFSYNSHHMIRASRAIVQGSYLGVSAKGIPVIVDIPEFELIVPEGEVGYC